MDVQRSRAGRGTWHPALWPHKYSNIDMPFSSRGNPACGNSLWIVWVWARCCPPVGRFLQLPFQEGHPRHAFDGEPYTDATRPGILCPVREARRCSPKVLESLNLLRTLTVLSDSNSEHSGTCQIPMPIPKVKGGPPNDFESQVIPLSPPPPHLLPTATGFLRWPSVLRRTCSWLFSSRSLRLRMLTAAKSLASDASGGPSPRLSARTGWTR